MERKPPGCRQTIDSGQRWQINECRMMKRKKRKSNQSISSEAAGPEGRGDNECVSFPLSQGPPLMLCALLLPHSLPSVPPRSRQRCGVSAPLPSSLPARFHAPSLRRYGESRPIRFTHPSAGDPNGNAGRITTNVKNINRQAGRTSGPKDSESDRRTEGRKRVLSRNSNVTSL